MGKMKVTSFVAGLISHAEKGTNVVVDVVVVAVVVDEVFVVVVVTDVDDVGACVVVEADPDNVLVDIVEPVEIENFSADEFVSSVLVDESTVVAFEDLS
jgi:hypothetical protein